jgi:hypothetical protein
MGLWHMHGFASQWIAICFLAAVVLVLVGFSVPWGRFRKLPENLPETDDIP